MINLKRLIKSFLYAFKGLYRTFVEEQNLRIQALAGIAVIILGCVLKITKIEWCVILIAIGLVILTEIINSAIERVTDVLKPRINTYAKEIKDVMAAAVMISSLLAVIVGVIIFFPYLFAKN